MKPETLKQFKKEVRKFASLYEKLIENWNGKLEHGNNATYPVTIVIDVLIHNIGFDGSNCKGYDHDKAESKMREDIKLLNDINEYENYSFMTHYPCTQISYILDGHEFIEFYDEY